MFGKKKSKEWYANKIDPNNINYGLIRAMINEAKDHICEVKLPNGFVITIKPIVESDRQIDILDL